MELVTMNSELMPKGKPDFLGVVKYPMISDLVQTHGTKQMLACLVLLVKDFCSSLNVVRNMNEDQMIEAAAMLLDECDNFRMEDYLMMFTMAKKGEFSPEVKIYDRVDIQLIAVIMDCYWQRRKAAGNREHEEQLQRLDSIGDTRKQAELMHPEDAKMAGAVDGLAAAMESLREGYTRPMNDEEARADIHTPAESYEWKEGEGFTKK